MKNSILSLSALLIVFFFLGGCKAPQAPVVIQPPIPTETPVEIPEVPKEKDCCVICRIGQPCGNSCIDATLVCTKPPGCACKAE